MADSLNKVMIIGNLGRDPELRSMPNGKSVTNFSVAVGRRWTTPDGEQREETEWFHVVLFEKLGEIANQYLSKGQKVYIEGRLQTHSWDGNDGQKHSRTEVIANQMVMLGGPQGPGAGRPAGAVEGGPEATATEDDLPF